MAYRLVRECLNRYEWEAWERVADPYLDPGPYGSASHLAKCREFARKQIRALLLPNG